MNYQPIDKDTPRDGTKIVIARFEQPSGSFSWAGLGVWDTRKFVRLHAEPPYRQPTHWAPLP